MDKNSAKSITKITESLHEEANQIFESLMEEEFAEASKNIDSMMESLKHLKTNLKEYEV